MAVEIWVSNTPTGTPTTHPGLWSLFYTSEEGESSHSFIQAFNSTKYYRLRTTGKEIWSEILTVVVNPEILAPTNLQVTQDVGKNILSWTNNAINDTEIEIYSSETGGDNPEDDPEAWELLDTVAASITTFEDTTAPVSEERFYLVRAKNEETESDWSNLSSGTAQ